MLAKVRLSLRSQVGLSPIVLAFVSCIAIASLFTSCFDEEFVTDIPTELTFSVDTLRFDTVFTSLGSATRGFSVKNLTSENIIVSSFRLEKGGESMFRMNVDGIPGDEVNDVKILANDSIYIFIEVTVDPDQPLSVSPFLIRESLIATVGGRESRMTLEAYGQNANYFPSRDARGRILGLSCAGDDLVWDDEKPYVIYGLLVIDSCRLVIAPGTEVYVNGGLARNGDSFFEDGGLIFLSEASITSEGTVDQPVSFQGIRLEESFQDVGGQWAGLRFTNRSTNNVLRHTSISQSSVGIRADSASSVELSSVEISNTANIGLIAVHASVYADNLLIHSNGPQSLAMVYGGNYEFVHATFANYQNQSPAVYMDNFTCLDEDCTQVAANPLNVSFVNSIIMGSDDDEIQVNDISAGAEEELLFLLLQNTLVRVDEQRANYPPESCADCIEYTDELEVFIDSGEDLYMLDTMSVGIGRGISFPSVPVDILGRPRDLNTPDLGCFEFQN